MTTQRKAGRPPKLKLVTIDEAIIIVKNHYQNQPRYGYSRGTIYNKISNGTLKNHGKRHCALLDENEVIKKLCS